MYKPDGTIEGGVNVQQMVFDYTTFHHAGDQVTADKIKQSIKRRWNVTIKEQDVEHALDQMTIRQTAGFVGHVKSRRTYYIKHRIRSKP